MNRYQSRRFLVITILLLSGAPLLHAQRDFSKVEIKAQAVSKSVHMLTGTGGNIGVSAGEDGVFLIDDQFAPLTDRILAAVKTISDKPVKFLLNTHYHGDHTGGNENLGKGGVIIIAHENVRARLSTEQFMKIFDRHVPASPKAALPIITFDSDVTFHLNGETIEAFHVDNAHTDGDTIVRFREANAVHMGDVFFNGFYPFIDVGSGGSIDGIITAAEKVLGETDKNTRIIPGHGPLANRKDLRAYVKMLRRVRKNIGALVEAGKTLEQTLAAKPTRALDKKWGNGFMKPEKFVSIVYGDLSSK